MTLPNFLIIGAAKCGTTAMYQYLKQHPQISMSSVKEPNFFAYREPPLYFRGPQAGIIHAVSPYQSLIEYETVFDDVSPEATAIGEASVMHLYIPDTAEQIHQTLPRAKLIIILRQPADRAYASYLHAVRADLEPQPNFAQALAVEPQRIREGWMPFWHYRQRGYYAEQLERYLRIFPREQLRIYLYEDWRDRPQETLHTLFQFLGVDDKFVPDLAIRHNVSEVPRSRAFNHWLKHPNLPKSIMRRMLPRSMRSLLRDQLGQLNTARPAPLNPDLRQQLTAGYRDDILKLQKLIDRDLSHWLAR